MPGFVFLPGTKPGISFADKPGSLSERTRHSYLFNAVFHIGTLFNEIQGFGMANKAVHITPLAQESRTAIPTSEAAAHLNRAAQTLWLWACKESGPLRPIRVNGRLAWKVEDLRRVLEAQ